MRDRSSERAELVTTQLVARGIRDARVLQAMREIPRELFVPDQISELAYRDMALPIENDQTISQPYIVALTLEALQLRPTDRVLEIGAGSGYQAALLGKLAREVYSVERHPRLVELSRERIARLELDHVQVVLANGTLGHPDKAPYDAIAVAAGGPDVPHTLLDQLAVNGRLVIPIGDAPTVQKLVRFVRKEDGSFERTELCDVCFVPLIGEHGWDERVERGRNATQAEPPDIADITRVLRESAEPFGRIDSADLTQLVHRIGDAQIVVLGAATYGSSEFVRMRARITRELILRRGFNLIALEADWPDAEGIDRYVRHRPPSKHDWRAFARFPQWIWRNREAGELIEWLHAYNAEVDDHQRRVGVFGLDLYSAHASTASILRYLDVVDPRAAKIARDRYGGVSAPSAGKFESCEADTVAMLEAQLAKRMEHIAEENERFFEPRLVDRAEEYYRALYHGSLDAWRLRDVHMFGALHHLLETHESDVVPPKVVVWTHNVHAGDIKATQHSARTEANLGHLCRRTFGDDVQLIGFGTDHGQVVAASAWDRPARVMKLPPAISDSYEHAAQLIGVPRFILQLRNPGRENLRAVLSRTRLERAIGPIYRPDAERAAHYFFADLSAQFDEWIWFDETTAIHALAPIEHHEVPATHPFGL